MTFVNGALERQMHSDSGYLVTDGKSVSSFSLYLSIYLSILFVLA